MESSLSKMEKDGLYLLTIGQVLYNTKNISNVSLYYNRISIVNNLRRYENNYCWVHETKSQLQKFPEDIKCACMCAENKNNEDSKLCQLRKNIKCPQEVYVRNITNELNKKNLIVDFSSLQCISLIYKGRLYLYSNLSTCKLNPQPIVNYSEKDSSRGIICDDCKTGEPIEFSKGDIERALYDIIERGEDQKYGLTLMEHTSLGTPLHGLEKVQDSVRSIGILEGSITDEPKESGIDKINVIDCDILLEDVNPAGSNNICCPSSQTACYTLKDQDCNGCKYINDLNDYLNTPINNYNTKLNKECKIHPKCDNHCDKCENHDHSSSKPENNCCENGYNGCCGGNCHCSEKCECPGCRTAACGPSCCCQGNCGCNSCQVHKHKLGFKKEFGIDGKLGGDYLKECVKFANDLVNRANNELESICSSLINQVNSMCQPPLKISIRFIEHFLCFEYLIEYNCDLNTVERDSLYGIGTLDKQNVILHEFIQSNVLTKQILEETFKLILGRIKMYIIPKSKEENNEDNEYDKNQMKLDSTNMNISNSISNMSSISKESGDSLNNLKQGNSEKVDNKHMMDNEEEEYNKNNNKDRHNKYNKGDKYNNNNINREDNNNTMLSELSPSLTKLFQNNDMNLKEEMGMEGVEVDIGTISPNYRQDNNVETPTSKVGLQISNNIVNGYSISKLSDETDDTKLVDSSTPTTNTGSNDTTNGPNSRDGLNETPNTTISNTPDSRNIDDKDNYNRDSNNYRDNRHNNNITNGHSTIEINRNGLNSDDVDMNGNNNRDDDIISCINNGHDIRNRDGNYNGLNTNEINTGLSNTINNEHILNTVTSLDNSSNLDESSNPISSDDSYKNSYQDLDQVVRQQNSSQELVDNKHMIDNEEEEYNKNSNKDSSDVEMDDLDTYNEIYPYWWKFYVDDNTLGEGDVNARYEGIRRFTRSYMKEESSTPKNKKSGNGANYLLTRCVSSDFSTKSNINVSGLHSSRETLCPSEFNQSQTVSGQLIEILPCFCKNCIPFISNITRMFPSHTSNLSNSLKNDFISNLEFRNLKEIVNSRTSSILSSRISSSPRISNSNSESIINRDSIESISPNYRQDSNRSIDREEEIEHDFNIVNGLRRSLRAARDVATVIRKKLSKEHKPLLDTLNVALLSSLRLGEYLFNNTNVYSGSSSIEQIQLDNTNSLDNRFELFNEQLNGYKGSSGESPRSPNYRQDSNRSIERDSLNGIGIKNRDNRHDNNNHHYKDMDNYYNKEDNINSNRDNNYRGFMDNRNKKNREGHDIRNRDGNYNNYNNNKDKDNYNRDNNYNNRDEEDVGAFLFLDVGMDNTIDTGRSTFENDQYLSYDIVSEDDACSYSSISSSSPKMFNKRKSPSRSRRAYRSFSSLEGMPSSRRSYEGLPNNKRSYEGIPSRRSFEGLPSSRRSTRELPQDDMYIYDMNNLSDKGEFEDWYADSDSSKKSTKYVQKRMPPSRPSVSNLTEIYGSQDMLIPMGPLPIGVYFDASRKLWRCQWRENGKFRTKGFSLGHYNTLADARHACILFRCQVGNMNIQPEWLTPNYIKVSDLLNRRAAQPSTTPKKSNRKKKRHEDLYEPYP